MRWVGAIAVLVCSTAGAQDISQQVMDTMRKTNHNLGVLSKSVMCRNDLENAMMDLIEVEEKIIGEYQNHASYEIINKNVLRANWIKEREIKPAGDCVKRATKEFQP